MLTLEHLYDVYDQHKEDYNIQIESFNIGDKTFDFNARTSLLGVVNLSVDSWFNHAVCYTPEQAIRRGKILTAEGADIIDIGAEASSQNTQRVDELKQKSALFPVIEALSQEGVLTSIETYYPDVAKECLKLGANVINFTGTANSEEMYRVVADFDAAIIICYIQGSHARDVEKFDFTGLTDPIPALYDYFGQEIEKATKLGVNKIFIDPAIGLGYKNFYYQYKHVPTRLGYQIQALLNSFRLRKLGFPVFNQLPTALEVFAEEVRSAQLLTAVFAALGKNDLIRTHEVSKVKALLETLSLV